MKYHGGINIFRYLFDCVLEVVYPRNYKCLCCGKEIDNKVVCKRCDDKSAKVEDIELVKNKKIYSCRYYSSTYRNLVMNYKSRHNYEVGDYFASLLFEKINESDITFDYITFVPSSSDAIKRRGFDHAKYMAVQLSKLTKKKNVQILHKSSDVKEQKKLNRYDRAKNLRLAFDVNQNLNFLEGSKILLIDDVVTTSATLESCVVEIEKYYNVDIILLTVIKSSI